MLSAVGGLILFFSWVVTNTLKQNYQSARARIEAAQENMLLFNTLHELRDMVNSLAMEVVQQKTGADASRLMAGVDRDARITEWRRRMALTRLSAHQVRELMDFAAQTQTVSRAMSGSTAVGEEIDRTVEQISDLHGTLATYRRRAEMEHGLHGDQLLQSGGVAIQEYDDAFRSQILPQVPALYHRIVELSNQRQQEARDHLAATRRRSEVANRIALILYAGGSIMVVLDRFFAAWLQN